MLEQTVQEKEVILQKLIKVLRKDVDKARAEALQRFDQIVNPKITQYLLFGAGDVGKYVLKGLRKLGIEPLGFVDNESSLWGKAVDGIKIMSHKEAYERFNGEVGCIVTINKEEDICQQFRDRGFKNVVSFIDLFLKYHDVFLPYYSIDLPDYYLSNIDDILSAYHLLADDESRREYFMQIDWRTSVNKRLFPTVLNDHDQYFPDKLFSLPAEGLIVDCGAYDGDTLRTILKKQKKKQRKILALEPDPILYEKLENFYKGLPRESSKNILIKKLGVTSRRETVYIEHNCSGGSTICDEGNIAIECDSLDNIVENEDISFIKMDVEGAEYDALLGARSIIKRCNPVLVICVYHRPDHLWSIPLLINSISSQYSFFIRRYRRTFLDTVCYAIPKSC